MQAYEITAEINLKKIIPELREVAQAFNELADNLDQIEKKYAKPQESGDTDTAYKRGYNRGYADAIIVE